MRVSLVVARRWLRNAGSKGCPGSAVIHVRLQGTVGCPILFPLPSGRWPVSELCSCFDMLTYKLLNHKNRGVGGALEPHAWACMPAWQS